MIEPTGGGPRPISPQLALRVAVLGGVAVVLFAVVFFRLWYLQVLSGNDYVSQANDNRVREVRVQAPRGDIVDRTGRVIVASRPATVVEISPAELPAPGAPRRALYARLGKVLQLSPQRIQRSVIEQRQVLPYAPAIVKTDVPQAELDFLLERATRFPGVTPDTVFLRSYPQGQLAAQLLGTVGQIGPDQLKRQRFRGVKQGTVVGQSGLEYTYDRYLRGRDGAQLLQVNAEGQLTRTLRQRPPVPGRQLKLSLDLALQKEGQAALLRAGGGKPGAFVALDPRDGRVLAMGSAPSFDPSVFAKPISKARYAALNSEANGAPLFDRAIGGLYPTGSTFKPITATAALRQGVITPQTPIFDAGCFNAGAQQFCSPGDQGHGSVALSRALQVSSDVFFYTLGARLNSTTREPLQKTARQFGLGRPTGIDLPDEGTGNVPDRAWRARIARRELACEKRRKVASCGISDGRPWSIGDNINLAVGQGDLQASPLQMAVAYSALFNRDGTVPTPHLGLEVDDSQGRLVQELSKPAARHIAIDQSSRDAIKAGLHLAASTPQGTSGDVFAGWPQGRYPVFGKTGTAERSGQRDQSWYVCFVPDPKGGRPIVVAVTIEQGGFGAEAAAPAARLILSKWFGVKAEFVAGKSGTF